MAPPKVPEGCPLTTRQFQVLQLLGEGLTGQQVGLRLGITHSTVRDHSHFAFRALGCSSTAQAVSIMGRSGWMGWTPADDASPLAVKHPFLAAYLQEFEASRWPHVPDDRSMLGMRLALAGHRNHKNRRVGRWR